MARVIRPRGARVIPAEEAAAHSEAERILRRAREEAASLVERTRAELQREARREARAELAAAHLELERARREVLASARRSIGPLAMAAARRLIGDALSAEPELIRRRVEETLDRVRRAATARVRVHPADLERLRDLQAEVVGDDTLSPGDCVVESDLGVVDARIEVGLEALAEALAQLGEEREGR